MWLLLFSHSIASWNFHVFLVCLILLFLRYVNLHEYTLSCRVHGCSSEHSDLSFGPRQANLVLIAYASSEGSGEPAHPRSLARTFAARSYKQDRSLAPLNGWACAVKICRDGMLEDTNSLDGAHLSIDLFVCSMAWVYRPQPSGT